MQDELNRLEERWGLALQNASFGVWDLDPRRQLVHYSPQWKQMLGYPAGNEPDSTAIWRSRVHPEDLQPMLDAVTAHLERRADSYEMEFRLRAADGSYRWVLSRGRVVERGAQDEPLRMVGTLIDQTDRHEAESLRQARDRADAANRAKTEFLSRMSHELRTPLNAVLGFAQLLSQRLGDGDIDAQRRHVEHIEQASWHLLGMINDVLDLSRVESGQLAMSIAPVPLAALAQTVCDMLGPMAQGHGVQILPAVQPCDAVVRADPERLKQVLTNLLSNAIKYNRSGGTVTVELSPVATGWALSVTDTGPGIAPEQMRHLFEPFNRLGRIGPNTEGVGLGLVLARWLVEKMDGELTARSTVGRGSMFAVRLPAA